MRKFVFSLLATLAVATSAATTEAPLLALPGQSWKLSLDLSGFAVESQEARPDGSGKKVVFKHSNKRMHVTVVMKPASPGASAVTIRDERCGRLLDNDPSKQSVALWAEGEQALCRYYDETYLGTAVHQMHIHTFIVHQGTRIEVHVSVTRYTEEDRPWLEHFAHSIEVVSRSA